MNSFQNCDLLFNFFLSIESYVHNDYYWFVKMRFNLIFPISSVDQMRVVLLISYGLIRAANRIFARWILWGILCNGNSMVCRAVFDVSIVYRSAQMLCRKYHICVLAHRHAAKQLSSRLSICFDILFKSYKPGTCAVSMRISVWISFHNLGICVFERFHVISCDLWHIADGTFCDICGIRMNGRYCVSACDALDYTNFWPHDCKSYKWNSVSLRMDAFSCARGANSFYQNMRHKLCTLAACYRPIIDDLFDCVAISTGEFWILCHKSCINVILFRRNFRGVSCDEIGMSR